MFGDFSNFKGVFLAVAIITRNIINLIVNCFIN